MYQVTCIETIRNNGLPTFKDLMPETVVAKFLYLEDAEQFIEEEADNYSPNILIIEESFNNETPSLV